MGRIGFVLVIATVTAGSMVAHAGAAEYWHGTHYGMSLPQVLAAVPEAHRVVPPAVAPIGVERAVAEHLSLDGHPYSAEFWFHGDILDAVRLKFDVLSVKPGDSDWIKAKLTDKYGKGQCYAPPADGWCEWNGQGTEIGLIVSDTGPSPIMLISFEKRGLETGL